MIEKPAEIITAYMTDSQNKEVVIEHEGIDYNSLNYYTGDMRNSMYGWSLTMAAGGNTLWFSADPDEYVENYKPYIHPPIIDDWRYFCFYFDFQLHSVTDASLKSDYYYFYLRFYYDEQNPNLYTYATYGYPVSDYDIYSQNTFRVVIPNTDPNIDKITSAWKILIGMVVLDQNTTQAGAVARYSIGVPRVFYSTEYYIDTSWTPAPNFETLNRIDLAYSIDNHELLLQDFSLTESLCSQDNIKFGLCEAAHCEFSCVTNDNPKTGDKISIVSKLPGASALSDAELMRINWCLHNPTNGFSYTYPNYDPFFVVYITPSNMADWSHYINSLNLKQKTLHVRFELRLTFSNVTGTTPTYFKRIEEVYYNGTLTEVEENSYHNVSDFLLTYNTINAIGSIVVGTNTILEKYNRVKLKFYDANKNPFTFGNTRCTYVVESRNWQFGVYSGGNLPAYDREDLRAANGTLDEYIYLHNNAIPLGIFYINSVSKKYRHNLVEKKIEAYDNMVVLEQNAADWYTSYMFGVNTDDWTSNGFEFARQIFSSYFNYVISIGLETKSRYIESEIASYSSAGMSPYLSNKYLSWLTPIGYIRLRYACFPVSNPDPTKLYMVKCVNQNGKTDDYILEHYVSGSYKTEIDPLSRGVCTNGGVMVLETRDNGTTAGFCVNRDDYFMISPNCTSFDVYIPVRTVDENYNVLNILVDTMTIYEVESAPRLVNGYLRLCYYNYGTKDIFACNSSITGRDVVRSLLEVCGCFFRLSRFNGLPEFVYPTKGGLYPSNTLFPADDLYPRSGTDGVYPMGRYMSVIAENYEVKDFGRIQILKDSKSNDVVSVCEWQYEGNPNAENTYIIDDNIFYCADDMMYDYDNMPEVTQMLAGMYNVISNLGFTPNVTEAIGSPWIECGDRLGLLTYDGGIETFVFRRTLKGIQNLKDTYESVGDEVNEAIDDFGY